jgi:hypothetical protein
MDHEVVVRQKITEQYLLDELDSDARDEFEEHFFDCPDCAMDVRAGSSLVDHLKKVLAKTRETKEEKDVYNPGYRSGARGWLGWLNPSFAAPVLALLLLVVGYQNLVVYPGLRKAADRPQVLPWASVNTGTWGSGGPVLTAHPGEGFLLFVRVPPEDGYTNYTAELFNPSGVREWSLAIPASYGQDQWPLRVPPANREAGSYVLALRGVTSTGESKEVGRASFELKIGK